MNGDQEKNTIINNLLRLENNDRWLEDQKFAN